MAQYTESMICLYFGLADLTLIFMILLKIPVFGFE